MLNPGTNPIDLTSLQAVKDFAEITSNKDDAVIQSLITAFGQWCLTYCSRETLNAIQSFTEIYDGNGSTRLYTRNSPIQTLTSILIDGQAMPISSGFGQAGAFIEQTKRSIGIRQGSGGAFITTWYPAGRGPAFAFWKGQGNVQLVYSAGYPPTNVSNDILTIAANTVALTLGPWVADLGVVFYPSLTPLVKVALAPAAGQYAVVGGLYVFNTADNGSQVAVSYQINQAPADLELMARRTVGILCKRRQWLDMQSKTLSAQGGTGTIRYRDWKLTPEDQVTIESYKRFALT